MKILFFVHSFPCVSETFVLNQVTGLIDLGHEVRVYAWGKPDNCVHSDYVQYDLKNRTRNLSCSIPQNKVKRILKALPILFQGLKHVGPKFLTLFSPKYGENAYNLLFLYVSEIFLNDQSWKPDAVITHFGDNGLFVNAYHQIGLIDKDTKCYTFIHAHEICRQNIDETKKKYNNIFKSNDFILPISRFWESKLIQAGANPETTKIFHMGVDIDRFGYKDKRRSRDEIKILSVGRLVGQKGYEYAIKGVAEYIKETNLKVSYTIIGRGELEDKLKKIVRQNAIEDNVTFLGAQPQEVVSNYMAKSDIFLLPSVTDDNGYMEGIPVALMEAMALGLLCISTYHSGIPELIDNNETGFLCKEKDSSEITKTLMQIEHLSTETISKIKNTARGRIVSDYNIEKLILDLANMVESNISKHS